MESASSKEADVKAPHMPTSGIYHLLYTLQLVKLPANFWQGISQKQNTAKPRVLYFWGPQYARAAYRVLVNTTLIFT